MALKRVKQDRDSRVGNYGLRNSSYRVVGVADDGSRGSRQDCCESFATISGEYNVETYVFLHQMAYEHMREPSYVKKVEEYINSLGFDVELLNTEPKIVNIERPNINEDIPKENSYNKLAYAFRTNSVNYKKGAMTLASHSLIRALWSDRFDDLWDDVFMLRDLDELSHLDNYEIWQMAEYRKKYWGYHGLLPTEDDSDRKLHMIISMGGLKNRMNSSIHNTVHKMCAQKFDDDGKSDVTKALRSEVRKLFKAKKYVELYDKMSIKGQSSFGLCNDDSYREDWIVIGKTYDIKTLKNKRFILVKCEDGVNRRLKKTRFNLSE